MNLHCVILFLGFIIPFIAGFEFEYADSSLYPTDFDAYESENIMRHLILDGGESDDDNSYDSAEEFLPENSEKRDLIRGPSFSPKIDDDSASYEIAKEDEDLNVEGTKRKTITKSPVSRTLQKTDGFSEGEGEPGRNQLSQTSQHFTADKKETFEDRNMHNTSKKHRLLTKEEKALVSESLINLLYDWKKHNTPHKPHEEVNSEAVASGSDKHEEFSKLHIPITDTHKREDGFTTSNTQTPSTVVDWHQNDDVHASAVASSGSTAEATAPISSSDHASVVTDNPAFSSSALESTANVFKQNREHLNVLVNVNINERAARRSNVNQKFETETERRSRVNGVNKTTPTKPQSTTNKPTKVYGALEKLREDSDADSMDEVEEASGLDTESGSTIEDKNKTSSSYKKQKYSFSSETGMNESETEDVDMDEESGSSDSTDENEDSKSADLKKTKVTGDEGKKNASEDIKKIMEDNVMKADKTTQVNTAQTDDSKKQKGDNTKEKNVPKHAFEEEAQALKGENPGDTLNANKVDREENDLEHNYHANNSSAKNYRTKSLAEKAISLQKTITNSSKSNENESKENMDEVKMSKAKSSEAEDVGIEQVKDKNKTPKAIPSEAALGSKQPEAKMPSDKSYADNEELEFTKKEREEQKKQTPKNAESEKLTAEIPESKQKKDSDDKYETLAEVREKFKKWENRLALKKDQNDEAEKEDGKKEEEKKQANKNSKNENLEDFSQNSESKDEDKIKEPDLISQALKLKSDANVDAFKPDLKPKPPSPTSNVLKSINQEASKTSGKMIDTEELKQPEKKLTPLVDTKSSQIDDTNVAVTQRDTSKENDNTATPTDKMSPSKSWKEEERLLLDKLKNPYLLENLKTRKDDEDDDSLEDEDEKAQQQTKKKDETKETPSISKKEKAKFLEGVDRLRAKEMKAKLATIGSTEALTQSIDKDLSNVVDAVIKNENASSINMKLMNPDKDSLKELIDSQVADERKNDSTPEISIKANTQSLKQLQNFKNQILAEVEKIDRLEAEYGIEDHSTKDLDEAKDVLNKDLKVVRELEKNLQKKTKNKNKNSKTKSKVHRQLFPLNPVITPTHVDTLQTNSLHEHQKADAFDKEIATALQQKAESDVNAVDNYPPKTSLENTNEDESETIPETKLGFEMSEDDETKDVAKLVKHKKSNKLKNDLSKISRKKHPLAELHSLLKAEIHRLRLPNRGKNDPQLSNIRQLVQQRLKSMLENGDLDRAAVHNLTPDIKELGKLLKNRIRIEKKKKNKKHQKHKHKKKKISKKAIALMKESENRIKPLDRFNEGKAGHVLNQETNIDKQVETLPSETNLNKQPKPTPKPPPQRYPLPPKEAPKANNPLANNIAPAIDILKQAENNNLDSTQSNKMKTLLTTLNKKLGEIYTKAQGVHQTNPQVAMMAAQPAQQYPQQQQQQQQQLQLQQQQQYAPSSGTAFADQPFASPPNMTMASYAQPVAARPDPQNLFNPNSLVNKPAESTQQQAITPHNSYNQPALTKGEIHEEPVESEPEETYPKALADDEPVDTLVENLERDITEVWSYRNLFPDADSLGLDNDKVHNTYANLGSLSGLNLRRALNRALRGQDVGLAVVGGSISKGGPFSEKGLDYVLRSYFYAIEDYWNKIIRPVTGSSMIIRDVSIGGIATDYYSYCLQNHLPDDKLTNIVLWELSANDMRRYDDTQRPKPQPLEQFTRNVLSYKAKPALIYLNFFALFDWDPDLSAHCRNFEDEGEDDIAKYYKITSLSWRNMVCPLLASGNQPLFTKPKLFAEDNFHPSIMAHAQMSYIVTDYIRTEFLKNLVKMRNTYIADAVTRLQIPRTVYIPRPMFPQTYTWKPLCYTYMLVDNRSPNNTLPLDEEKNGNFRYTVVREFKIRSDKIVGMETQQKDQYIRYRIHIPRHSNGGSSPYKRLGIMSFTDDRTASIQFDSEPPKEIESKKKFLEGTIIKYIADNVAPGEHSMTIRSGMNGFLVCAVVLG